MDTQIKSSSSTLHWHVSCIMRYKSNLSNNHEKEAKKNKQRKNWIDPLSFFFFFFLPCPIKSVAGLLHMQHITRGRVTTKNCQSTVSDGGHRRLPPSCSTAEHPASTEWRGGTLQKPWHRIHHILHYIYDTNVNRFIYFPMFKYICRLYTNL